ncbi:MAG: efflux RND transporter periplasmic adaptor subunit [Nitrospirae bacterium]|nr:efflux RND transporter periplasmic adaptor subunit [Nitrospirota bacterium]
MNIRKIAWMAKLAKLAILAVLAVVAVSAWRGADGGGKKEADQAARKSEKAGKAAARIVGEGRLVAYPGAQVTVSAEIAAVVERMAVKEKSAVKRGELIAEMKSADLQAALGEAQAGVAEAETNLKLAEAEVERAEKLLATGVATRQLLDKNIRDRDAAKARGELAGATVKRIEATIAKTRIVSPIDGVVIDRHAHPGEMLDVGRPIVTIANLRRTRIEAEVDEYDAGRMAVGSPVAVTAEGYDGMSWKGHVEEVPDAVTSRSLKPQDPGKPSDTRVLVVKVALDEPTPLKLGQRVEVAIAAGSIAGE